MEAARARWAALVPWEGVQGKPDFLLGPDGNIQISDVQGLAAALAARALIAQLAKVAFSGRYTDLTDTPAFGSAAFVDISYFLVAWTAKTLQIGEVAIALGMQSYAVVFTTTMDDVPEVLLQTLMTDGSGELFWPTVQRDSITTLGFSFWLSGVPSANAGFVHYEAKVQPQP